MIAATSSVVAGRRRESVIGDLTSAAPALQRSPELADDLAEQFDHLLDLLDARALIEQAKGMLMAAGLISAAQAFELLRRQSQYENVELRDVAARHVLLHSTAPPPFQPPDRSPRTPPGPS